MRAFFVISILLMTFLMFKDNKDAKREGVLKAKQLQIKRSTVVLDSLGQRGVLLEYQVDSLEREVNKTEIKVSKLKSKKPFLKINI